MPMARSVPISRVRSRMAIHMVFMMPMPTMHMRIVMSTRVSQRMASRTQVMNEISSSHVVTSSF